MKKPTPKVTVPPAGAIEVWETYRTAIGSRGTSSFTQREIIFIGPEAEAKRIQSEGGARHHVARRFAIVLEGKLYLLATLNPTVYLAEDGRYVRPKIPPLNKGADRDRHDDASPPQPTTTELDHAPAHPVHLEETPTRSV